MDWPTWLPTRSDTGLTFFRKDFSMRSLKGKEASAIEDEVDADEEKDLRPFQLRAHWEKR